MRALSCGKQAIQTRAPSENGMDGAQTCTTLSDCILLAEGPVAPKKS